MYTFVVYEGDENTRPEEEKCIGELTGLNPVFKWGDTSIPIKIEEGVLKIPLTEETSKRLMIMGGDGNWTSAQLLFDTGIDELTLPIDREGSLVLLADPSGEKWRAIHAEREIQR